jgi:hypothetical protein
MKIDLSRKDLDIKEVAKAALGDEELLLELIRNLKTKKETIRFNSSKALNLICETNPEVLYPDWDYFFELLEGDNTYWKCSAIPLIANLTRVDEEKKFETYFEKYFDLMNDRSFIPAAYVARSAATIADAKPKLRTKITEKLLGIDETRHNPQRRDLVKSDIIEAFDKYFEKAENKRQIIEFVRLQLDCDSPKTRKTATKFLEKWEYWQKERT